MHIVLPLVQISIFEIQQLWQSGFSRVYSNCCCSCSFEPEIINIGQSSHKMYSTNILNFQESMTILNACTKKVWKLIECTIYIYIYIYIYIHVCVCMYTWDLALGKLQGLICHKTKSTKQLNMLMIERHKLKLFWFS